LRWYYAYYIGIHGEKYPRNAAIRHIGSHFPQVTLHFAHQGHAKRSSKLHCLNIPTNDFAISLNHRLQPISCQLIAVLATVKNNVKDGGFTHGRSAPYMVQTASIIMHYHAGAWERETLLLFTKSLTESAVRVYGSVIAAIVASEFSSLEYQSGRKPTFQSAAFFVSKCTLTLWSVVRGGASLLVSLVPSLLTLHGWPPAFSSSDGRYNRTLGASL